jgi:hypothetical protein
MAMEKKATVYLTAVYLTAVYLTAVYLTAVYLTAVYSPLLPRLVVSLRVVWF